MVYLCVCFGSMFTVLVQRYSKLHSAEALIVVNWPMGVVRVNSGPMHVGIVSIRGDEHDILHTGDGKNIVPAIEKN